MELNNETPITKIITVNSSNENVVLELIVTLAKLQNEVISQIIFYIYYWNFHSYVFLVFIEEGRVEKTARN